MNVIQPGMSGQRPYARRTRQRWICSCRWLRRSLANYPWKYKYPRATVSTQSNVFTSMPNSPRRGAVPVWEARHQLHFDLQGHCGKLTLSSRGPPFRCVAGSLGMWDWQVGEISITTWIEVADLQGIPCRFRCLGNMRCSWGASGPCAIIYAESIILRRHIEHGFRAWLCFRADLTIPYAYWRIVFAVDRVPMEVKVVLYRSEWVPRRGSLGSRRTKVLHSEAGADGMTSVCSSHFRYQPTSFRTSSQR